MAKKKTSSTFKKGDKIIHPFHGGGVVVDIVKKELGKEINQYYLINIIHDSLNLYIPLNALDKVNIKKVESKRLLEECLTMMRKNNFKLFRKPAVLENQVRVKIDNGNLLSLAEAIGLIGRFKAKKEKEGKISPLNKNLLDLFNHAKKLFISRIALIRNVSYSSAQTYLDKLINHNLES